MLAATSIKVMDALFGFLAQNDAETYIDESFWDGLGVEIGPCAIFDNFAVLPDPVKFAAAGKNMPDLMLGDSAMGSPLPRASDPHILLRDPFLFRDLLFYSGLLL